MLFLCINQQSAIYNLFNTSMKKSNVLNTGILDDDHTATMVPLFSFGPGSKKFIGIYHNNQLITKC